MQYTNLVFGLNEDTIFIEDTWYVTIQTWKHVKNYLKKENCTI